MVPIKEPFDIVLTSNSGYPLDLNLYQSVKGISAAAQAVKQGGAILIVTECWDGIPDHGSYRRLAGMVIDYMRAFIADKPKLAALLSYTRVVAAWDAGFERVCRGAPHVIAAHADKNRGFGAEDTALALSYLELYAPVLGRGTCWAGYFYAAVNAHPPLFEALKLPAKHKAFGAMMVGYPKFRYQRLAPRKPPKVTWL